DSVGVDRLRLGTEDDTRRRFLRAIPSGDPDQQSLAFAIMLNDELVGYTLLNRYTPLENYSHWHIINPLLLGLGLSTLLYPHRLKTYFDATAIDQLVHQTRTHNIAVNRMLDRWVPVAETRYIQRPDGVSLPGEFHLRYVHRKDLPKFITR